MAAIPPRYQADPAPFLEWFDAQVLRLEDREDPVAARRRSEATAKAKALTGWNDDAGARRLHRWRHEQLIVDRRDIEAALEHAGVSWWEVYPDPADHGQPLPDEEFCWRCRSFVTPYLDEGQPRCPWDDHAIIRIDLSALPPRDANRPPAPAPAPSMIVRHQPRAKLPPRPFYLDVRLDIRRAVLERYADTGSIAEAAQVAADAGIFASTESAASAVRTLLEREGWWTRPGRSPARRQAAALTAQELVCDALASGTWDRVVEQTIAPSCRTTFDERLLREAAWLYFYDELGFGTIAKRLLHRSSARNAKVLKSGLIDEWNRRGWPRRTSQAAARWTAPAGDARCAAENRDGTECRRWAKKGSRYCVGHGEDRNARVAYATAASRAAYADAVPLEPWRQWLRLRVAELGSVAAIHRRVGAVVGYDTLAAWTRRRPRGGGEKVRSVRRSTIDRVLAAWGEGVTFEDIYLPVVSEDERLVPGSLDDIAA